MKKYIVIFILLVASLFVISGCSDVASRVSSNEEIMAESGITCSGSGCSGSCTLPNAVGGSTSGTCSITTYSGNQMCRCKPDNTAGQPKQL